jgi:tyrosyl-tRNA synthetase
MEFGLNLGATGLIGDPSGKNTTRPVMDESVLNQNLSSIKLEIEKYFNKDIKILNNSGIVY